VLRDTLAETFGVMVYQEDVVNVCAVFAGMPLATADGLRKSLSKKRPARQLAGYAEEFFAGAVALGREPDTIKTVWEMIMSFAGYSFCKGHSASYIQVAQHSCYLRAHYPAEFMAAVLGNGGGFYHPFAYVAEAMRMGLVVHPPDVNASDFRCTGRGRELRIGLQFVKGLSADGAERLLAARGGRPYCSLFDLRSRAGIAADDLRALIKVGALDSIGGGWTRPMMLWMMDAGQQAGAPEAGVGSGPSPETDWFSSLPPAVPVLKEYSAERRRREEYAALGFVTDTHPMRLEADRLARFRLCRSTDLPRLVGRHEMMAGMLTTAKPVHTRADEPMEFVTFDDGDGLIETVLFPRVYRERGHVLFDQGPFIFRGKVEEEFGAITVTVTHLDRLERVAGRQHQGSERSPGWAD
jgi:DNA polymerase III alpha subunit